jgi:hypothetical protein
MFYKVPLLPRETFTKSKTGALLILLVSLKTKPWLVTTRPMRLLFTIRMVSLP